MKQFLMVRAADAVILGCMLQPDLDDGPQAKPPSPVPEGVSLVEFAGAFDRSLYPQTYVAKWVDGAVIWADSEGMSAMKARKSAAISQCCADAITAGFPCDALGAGYRYPAKPNDQANLTGSVLRSMYSSNDATWRTPFWCADADGAWEFRLHTAAQIQHVGDRAVNARLTYMATNEQLQLQIAAAETPEALAEINW